jgi:hypothetical protein
MTDPNLIISGLSHEGTLEGIVFRIEICKLEDVPGWSLEVVDEDGTSTVWDNQFDTDKAALEEALKAFKEEGLAAFRETGNVVQFPKR